MTRRKQNCPKKMKWDGEEGEEGEGQEEGSSTEGEDTERLSASGRSSVDSLSPERSIPPVMDLVTSSTTPSEDPPTSSPRLDEVEDEPSTPPPPDLQRFSPNGPASPALQVESAAASPCSPYEQPITAITDNRSPPALVSPTETTATVLDFSVKTAVDISPPILNLTKSSGRDSVEPPQMNGPLDLSTGTSRRTENATSQAVPLKRSSKNSSSVAPWLSPLLQYQQMPYFGNVAGSNSSYKTGLMSLDAALWNGKPKSMDKPLFGLSSLPQSEASKALEKMSELSRFGGDELRSTTAQSATGLTNQAMGAIAANSNASRHSAWQSHWLNKGAEKAKDVLKCVWCKQSFSTLAAMTTHMQEAKHCGMSAASANAASVSPRTSSATGSLTHGTTSSKISSSSPNSSVKETMPLPRKLVRGQDVWLGKGAEQTRQILKCMWCGQSFRSLAEMTSHMQQTQHYTNIISQEQIISWKSADENKSSGTSSSNSQTSGSNAPTSISSTQASSNAVPANTANSHISAVLTCKVCDQAFTSLKDLSNHMMKDSHYKEHVMRSITDNSGRRRQTREKRKKSLPVRKLLELERAQNELRNGDNMMMMLMMGKSSLASNRIVCEKCGERVEVAHFMDHSRSCVLHGVPPFVNQPLNDEKKVLKNLFVSHAGNTQTVDSSHLYKSTTESGATGFPKTSPNSSNDVKSDHKSSPPSVLNAIEKLIEKSFDSRSRNSVGCNLPGNQPGVVSPISSSILKRLGIDESVDYTKPLMDASVQMAKMYNSMMNIRQFNNVSYMDRNSSFGNNRERSTSESSSSEQSSFRHDSSTPDKKYDNSGDKCGSTPPSTPEQDCLSKNVKQEPKDELDDTGSVSKESFKSATDFTVKGELKRRSSENSDLDQDGNSNEPTLKRTRQESCSPTGSTSGNCQTSSPSSERSTPRSISGSLGALSTMFDNLNSNTGSSNSGSGESSSKRSKSSNNYPLAALQKLCEKTDTQNQRINNTNCSTSSSVGSQVSSPGAILAFSWACNDAVVTDSAMKCAFCDTPFISKGAYRHHLSKMHFVKDGIMMDPLALRSQLNSNTSPNRKSKSPNSSSSAADTSAPSSSTHSRSPPGPLAHDESSQSKFLKYTELAKQLSSKYT